MKITEHHSSRLQVGDIIPFGQQEYIVWLVNRSRAACAPLVGSAPVRVTTASDGSVAFTPAAHSESISPNSEVPILRRLGRAGIIACLEERKQKSEKQISPKIKHRTKAEQEAFWD